MKIETREDALLWCFTLWMDMARTGNSRKSESWVWKTKGGGLFKCEYDCPACQYVHINLGEPNYRECAAVCPIKWSSINNHCCSVNSEFMKWKYSTTKTDNKKWALEIAILALEALSTK